MEESKNDPIKRANLIQDIVRTISVIPDQITRSIYVKECSTLMSVSEDALYSELGKINRKKLEQTHYSHGVQSAPSVMDIPVPDTFASQNPYEIEEREVLRYLVKYGTLPLTNEVGAETGESVGQFIIREIKGDELQSVNPLYNKMFDVYTMGMSQGMDNSEKFFIHHPDMEVSRLASDLVSHRHQLSKIHKKRGEVKEEEMLLFDLVPKVVLLLKEKYIIHQENDIQNKIKAAHESGNHEMVLKYMMEKNDLIHLKKAIARLLGDRTIIK